MPESIVNLDIDVCRTFTTNNDQNCETYTPQQTMLCTAVVSFD